MNLFAPDLYRNFAIGFVAGALMLGASTVSQWAPQLESSAQAAAPISAPQPDAEFLIPPFEADA